MLNIPKVSVVMTIYNGEKYVKKAIESILQQTFKDFELIVIDDGSTDNSYNIIKGFMDNRIHLYKNDTNRGVCYSSNRGIGLAQGEYIARFDCDDISYKTRLEKQVQFLNEHPDIMLCSTFRDYIINGKREKDFTQREYCTHKEIRMQLLFGNIFTHSSVMFRKNLYIEGGFSYEKYPYAHDYNLMLDIAEKYNMYIIPERLVAYRLHPNQISNVYQRSSTTREVEKLKCEHIEHLNISSSSKSILKKLSIHNFFMDAKGIQKLNDAMMEIMLIFEFDMDSHSNEFNTAKYIYWEEIRKKSYKSFKCLFSYINSKMYASNLLLTRSGLKFCLECFKLNK